MSNTYIMNLSKAVLLWTDWFHKIPGYDNNTVAWFDLDKNFAEFSPRISLGSSSHFPFGSRTQFLSSEHLVTVDVRQVFDRCSLVVLVNLFSLTNVRIILSSLATSKFLGLVYRKYQDIYTVRGSFCEHPSGGLYLGI